MPSTHSLFPGFLKTLQLYEPSIPQSVLDGLSPQLASPLQIRLPHSVLEEAQNIVRDIHRLQHNLAYQNQIQKQFPFASFQKTPSLLNSLDVHIDSEQNLKIIEINTNASSYLVNAFHYLYRGISTFPMALQKLKDSFQTTFGSLLLPGYLFLIIDEKPLEQNMYIEFLLFRSFLKKEFGVDCEIVDVNELQLGPQHEVLWQGKKVSGIYNRYTDFYFTHSKVLNEAYQKSNTLLSPNPWNYALFADKNRLVDWSQSLPNDYIHLKKALPQSFRFSDFKGPDDLWSQKNKFFFKPPNAFGGRSVYKGKSISRTVFQRLWAEEYLAQEAVPAPEIDIPYDNQNLHFKYDLRFYFFEGEIHLGMARLYQGQVTNLQTPLGGLTPLEFDAKP